MQYNTLLGTVGGSSCGVCVLLIVNQTNRRWSCILCSVTACDTNYPHYGRSQGEGEFWTNSSNLHRKRRLGWRCGARSQVSHFLSGLSDDVSGHGNLLRHQVPHSYGFYSGLTHVDLKYFSHSAKILSWFLFNSFTTNYNHKPPYIEDDYKSVNFDFVHLPVVVNRLSCPQYYVLRVM